MKKLNNLGTWGICNFYRLLTSVAYAIRVFFLVKTHASVCRALSRLIFLSRQLILVLCHSAIEAFKAVSSWSLVRPLAVQRVFTRQVARTGFLQGVHQIFGLLFSLHFLKTFYFKILVPIVSGWLRNHDEAEKISRDSVVRPWRVLALCRMIRLSLRARTCCLSIGLRYRK